MSHAATPLSQNLENKNQLELFVLKFSSNSTYHTTILRSTTSSSTNVLRELIPTKPIENQVLHSFLTPSTMKYSNTNCHLNARRKNVPSSSMALHQIHFFFLNKSLPPHHCNDLGIFYDSNHQLREN